MSKCSLYEDIRIMIYTVPFRIIRPGGGQGTEWPKFQGWPHGKGPGT